MKFSLENLKLISDAIIECEAMLENLPPIDDGGSSNFDNVMINLEGWRKNQLNQIPRFGHKKSNSSYKGWCTILFPSKSQGFNRTHRAKTAKQFLVEKGIEAEVYYSID